MHAQSDGRWKMAKKRSSRPFQVIIACLATTALALQTRGERDLRSVDTRPTEELRKPLHEVSGTEKGKQKRWGDPRTMERSGNLPGERPGTAGRSYRSLTPDTKEENNFSGGAGERGWEGRTGGSRGGDLLSGTAGRGDGTGKTSLSAGAQVRHSPGRFPMPGGAGERGRGGRTAGSRSGDHRSGSAGRGGGGTGRASPSAGARVCHSPGRSPMKRKYSDRRVGEEEGSERGKAQMALGENSGGMGKSPHAHPKGIPAPKEDGAPTSLERKEEERTAVAHEEEKRKQRPLNVHAAAPASAPKPSDECDMDAKIGWNREDVQDRMGDEEREEPATERGTRTASPSSSPSPTGDREPEPGDPTGSAEGGAYAGQKRSWEGNSEEGASLRARAGRGSYTSMAQGRGGAYAGGAGRGQPTANGQAKRGLNMDDEAKGAARAAPRESELSKTGKKLEGAQEKATETMSDICKQKEGLSADTQKLAQMMEAWRPVVEAWNAAGSGEQRHPTNNPKTTDQSRGQRGRNGGGTRAAGTEVRGLEMRPSWRKGGRQAESRVPPRIRRNKKASGSPKDGGSRGE